MLRARQCTSFGVQFSNLKKKLAHSTCISSGFVCICVFSGSNQDIGQMLVKGANG